MVLITQLSLFYMCVYVLKSLYLLIIRKNRIKSLEQYGIVAELVVASSSPNNQYINHRGVLYKKKQQHKTWRGTNE